MMITDMLHTLPRDGPGSCAVSKAGKRARARFALAQRCFRLEYKPCSKHLRLSLSYFGC